MRTEFLRVRPPEWRSAGIPVPNTTLLCQLLLPQVQECWQGKASWSISCGSPALIEKDDLRAGKRELFSAIFIGFLQFVWSLGILKRVNIQRLRVVGGMDGREGR